MVGGFRIVHGIQFGGVNGDALLSTISFGIRIIQIIGRRDKRDDI